jgi:hypothetical protein
MGRLAFPAGRDNYRKQRQLRAPKKQAAATLQPRAAGSQDESPCGTIHKFKGNVNGAQLKLAITKSKPKRATLLHAGRGAREKFVSGEGQDRENDERCNQVGNY